MITKHQDTKKTKQQMNIINNYVLGTEDKKKLLHILKLLLKGLPYKLLTTQFNKRDIKGLNMI